MQTSTLSWIIVVCACASSSDPTLANSYGGELTGSFSDLFLRQLLTRLNDDQGSPLSEADGSDEGAGAGPPPRSHDDMDDSEAEDDMLMHDEPIRVSKDYPRTPSFRIRHDGSQNFLGPSIRDQEYLEHSSLWGHQYMQGGAGEGKQHLKPDGSVKNGQSVKTDAVLPAYCNPPNPCPIGYTAADGCLEDFSNTASFSRNYQAAQECMCDSEHMFDCPAENSGGATGERGSGSSGHGGGASRNPEMEIEALAQSMQHEGLVDSTLNRLVDRIEGARKSLVAKKFFNSRVKKSIIAPKLNMRRIAQNKNYTINQKGPNPYLMGEKLPVVAKKSPVVYHT